MKYIYMIVYFGETMKPRPMGWPVVFKIGQARKDLKMCKERHPDVLLGLLRFRREGYVKLRGGRSVI